MSRWIIPPIAGLIEPSVVPEFFMDGVGAIELLGPCVRIYCCAEQLPLEAAGEMQKVVVLKIVRPIHGIPESIVHMARCLNPGPETKETGARPRLVT